MVGRKTLPDLVGMPMMAEGVTRQSAAEISPEFSESGQELQGGQAIEVEAKH
jgi:hypothetical protein